MKTAVEWLEEQVIKKDWLSESGKMIFQQAKEMEKEQIIDACKYANNYEQGDLRCEVYYKKKFKSE